jgi:hypothetical protein
MAFYVAMLLSWGGVYALFVCLFLRAAARARYAFGAISMLYSSGIACEQRPAPAIHLGRLQYFFFTKILVLVIFQT